MSGNLGEPLSTEGPILQSYQRQIKRIAEFKGIQCLYHFTPAINAESILRHGLVSRQILEDRDLSFCATDQFRLDGRLDAISLSIQYINTEMLLRKVRELGGDWLIFEIDASVLWTHNCRFCWTNAASSEITNNRSFLGGPWALERMFDDKPVNMVDRSSFREKYERAPNRPTDEQAEVQVVDPIDPSLIVDVTVRSQLVKRKLEALMETVSVSRPVVVNESLPL